MILLGISDLPTYNDWKRNVELTILSEETLERISFILSIYESLQTLLPDTRAADKWVRQVNSVPPFNGQSALDRMLSGQVNDQRNVRQYLDSQCV